MKLVDGAVAFPMNRARLIGMAVMMMFVVACSGTRTPFLSSLAPESPGLQSVSSQPEATAVSAIPPVPDMSIWITSHTTTEIVGQTQTLQVMGLSDEYDPPYTTPIASACTWEGIQYYDSSAYLQGTAFEYDNLTGVNSSSANFLQAEKHPVWGNEKVITGLGSGAFQDTVNGATYVVAGRTWSPGDAEVEFYKGHTIVDLRSASFVREGDAQAVLLLTLAHQMADKMPS
jgi:hypothetical protein